MSRKVGDSVWGMFNGVLYKCKIIAMDKKVEPPIYRLEMYPGIARWCWLHEMRDQDAHSPATVSDGVSQRG